MSERPPAFEIPVALVRDYELINRELTQALDSGTPLIRLTDVEGQRLLASRLHGPWQAVVEVAGNAGPELAADLDAPGLTVICTGSAADGAGRGLRAGRLAIRGDSGDATGAGMRGGSIVVAGQAGHRAGLRQQGGTLVLMGTVGRLLADRQSGGLVFADRDAINATIGRGRSGGRLVDLPSDVRSDDGALESITADDASAFHEAIAGLFNSLRSI